MSNLIWVTGASGFSGQALIKGIRQSCPDAFILSLSNEAHENPTADLVKVLDICDLTGLTKLAEQFPPNKVFHLAGVLGFADWSLQYKVNVEGTHTLLNALKSANVESCSIVSIGSAAEYLPKASGTYLETDPIGGITPYGRSKSAQTWLFLSAAKNFGYKAVVARVFNLIGPSLSRHLVLGEICAQIKSGAKHLKLGNLSSERDFIDIRDAVRAYWLLSELGEPGEVYNVSTGSALSIQALVDLAINLSGVSVDVQSETDKFKNVDINRSIGHAEKIRNKIQWAPQISLETSLRDMLV